MSFKRSRSPKSHFPIVQQSLQDSRSPELESVTRSAKKPELLHSVPVFTLGLNALLRSAALSKIRPSSWRYLLRASSGSKHVVDIATQPDSEHAALRQLRSGESGERLQKVIRSSEKHKKLQRRKYGVRLLRIPALHFSALWLKADANKHDVFVPVRSVSPKLRAGRHFSREEIATVLKSEAERTLRRQLPPS